MIAKGAFVGCFREALGISTSGARAVVRGQLSYRAQVAPGACAFFATTLHLTKFWRARCGRFWNRCGELARSRESDWRSLVKIRIRAPRVVRCVFVLCVGVMRFAQSACRLLGAMRSTRGPPGVCLWGRRRWRAGACAGCLVLGRACVVAVLQSRCFGCRFFLVSGSGDGPHFMITILPSRSKHT